MGERVSQEIKSAAPAYMARGAIINYNLLHSPYVPSPTNSVLVAMLIQCIWQEFSHPVHKVEDITKAIFTKLLELCKLLFLIINYVHI